MRKTLLITTLALISLALGAEGIEGQWNGMLDIYGTKLRLVVHFAETDSGLVATVDSPDQGAFGMEADSASFEDGTVEIRLESIKASYKGTLREGKLCGTFSQASLELPLDLAREELAAPVYNRPQNPVEPYPYISRDVTFENPSAGITLAGTLTLPSEEGTYPAVVLVSGSGAQDRNEELLAHKPFLVLADHLTRAGIAVLRYDDRGTAESEGDFAAATTYDLAEDALSAAAWLKAQPQAGKVGFIGHSEGGIIAPMAAAQDPDIDFIVLLAGTGIPGDQLLALQGELIMRAMGTSEDEIAETLAFNRKVYDLILNSVDDTPLRGHLYLLVEQAIADSSASFAPGYTMDEIMESIASQYLTPWMKEFIRLDPAFWLEQVQVPVLALNGGKDLQVPAPQNLSAIEASLAKGGNKSCKTIVYPDLNHLFQTSETGAPSEYGNIEETFSETAMKDIAGWVLQR